MIDDLIPMIDKTRRTIADRDHRAMAGLSMGGMETFHVTFNNLDKFSYIGGFSGAGIRLESSVCSMNRLAPRMSGKPGAGI